MYDVFHLENVSTPDTLCIRFLDIENLVRKSEKNKECIVECLYVILYYIILQNDLIQIPQNYATRHEVPPVTYIKVSTKKWLRYFLHFDELLHPFRDMIFSLFLINLYSRSK